MRRALLLLAALAPLAGCSKNVSITGKLNYGKTAEENYQAGVEELNGGHYAEATKFLEYVKTKYPFSKYAALAELRIADLKFKQERWPEAAEAYKSFVQLHPTNEDVDYAEYRVGLSHFRDAPDEFFLFPPAYEKDQHSLESAVTDFRDLLQSRPGSKFAADAKARLGEAITRLARHEWYVAEFYYKRKRWAGAAGRLEGLVKNYPDSKYDVDALFKLADVSLKMNEKHRAQKALQEVVVKHPDDPRRPEAEKQLASIR